MEPYYENMKKIMEIHITYTLTEDFYGQVLNVAIISWTRKKMIL